MPGRNSELIRQWSILRTLASNRRTTIAQLADETGKTERTVRRDLTALETAGFPLEEDQDEHGQYWSLPPRALAKLERDGSTIAELAALHMSRALFECFAQSAPLKDLQGAFDKMDAALSPSMRRFLNLIYRCPTTRVRLRFAPALAERLKDELESSRRLYPDGERRPEDPSVQPALPFSLVRLPTA